MEGLIEKAKYDHGHAGYSGTFAEAEGVNQSAIEFNTTKEAIDWLDDNCQKWGAIVVVQTPTHWVFGAVCSS